MNQYWFYLSGWIENFGVVPLFLFSAFLFEPAFLSLFLRMILVCLVFEAIILSYFQLLIKIRSIVLTAFCVKVKALLLIIFSLYHTALSAETPIIKYIQKGEQFSLSFPKGAQYSIGSRNTLKAKVLKKRNRILIKGIKAGLSDLIIWNSKNSKSYQIYVTTHEVKNHKSALTRYLKSQKISYLDLYDSLLLEIPIQTRQQLRIITNYCQKSCEGALTKELSQAITLEIYKLFLQHHLPYIYCHQKSLELRCVYRSDKRLSFEDQLEDMRELGVHFQQIQDDSAQNIEVQFHFSQLESKRSSQINLGLDQLQTNLAPFISNNPGASIENNPVNLNLQHFNARSIAKPRIITTLNSENEIKVGSETPFEVSNQFTQNIQWKFSGLKLKFKLYKNLQKYFIEYQATLSTQEGEQIKGHYKQAIIALSPNGHNLLFEIDLSSFTKNKQSLSFFSKLPLIGKLFRGKYKSQTHSKVIGTIFIKKLNEVSL